MRHILVTICGVATAAVASLVLAIGAGFVAGYTKYFLEAWPWLFAVSAGPCVLCSWGLALAVSYTRRGRWRLRLSALLAAYIAVALAGSVGAVAVESVRRGLERVNVSGYFTWCWIYGALFLPFSYPFARVLQRLIHRTHPAPGNLGETQGRGV